jgi:hypothetical protein
MTKKYSFTIVIKRYERQNGGLTDMRTIYADKTCICAKNQKFGGLYLHKNAKIIKGRFHNPAGSNQYPILFPKTDEVHIRVTGFDKIPNIRTNQHHKQDIISIIDITNETHSTSSDTE